ncbi:hypothetical protein J6590_008019 [Homalodisca vitripennis]|nr:hypothetical protein J6590_008019 [Homalodisca vitripennis]
MTVGLLLSHSSACGDTSPVACDDNSSSLVRKGRVGPVGEGGSRTRMVAMETKQLVDTAVGHTGLLTTVASGRFALVAHLLHIITQLRI